MKFGGKSLIDCTALLRRFIRFAAYTPAADFHHGAASGWRTAKVRARLRGGRSFQAECTARLGAECQGFLFFVVFAAFAHYFTS